jgi:CheY-like chemotaxis protein
MAGMTSIETHERLCTMRHAPVTILISAYPTPALEEKAAESGALVLLQDPYKSAVMSHWLSVAMGGVK